MFKTFVSLLYGHASYKTQIMKHDLCFGSKVPLQTLQSGRLPGAARLSQ
jgi:hypothetical protein